jgi:hypothetical protein
MLAPLLGQSDERGHAPMFRGRVGACRFCLFASSWAYNHRLQLQRLRCNRTCKLILRGTTRLDDPVLPWDVIRV